MLHLIYFFLLLLLVCVCVCCLDCDTHGGRTAAAAVTDGGSEGNE